MMLVPQTTHLIPQCEKLFLQKFALGFSFIVNPPANSVLKLAKKRALVLQDHLFKTVGLIWGHKLPRPADICGACFPKLHVTRF